ncbi:hypothetical protein [Maridesulfovibrio zosterae]|uniref:hypothetical protein n=1 Tax=Maridesulfovibrio zosterae TaxID=82171 RepID=UPI0012EB20DA|nr:hypothetical protein [Maridesulfovibrio zosterae]
MTQTTTISSLNRKNFLKSAFKTLTNTSKKSGGYNLAHQASEAKKNNDKNYHE